MIVVRVNVRIDPGVEVLVEVRVPSINRDPVGTVQADSIKGNSVAVQAIDRDTIYGIIIDSDTTDSGAIGVSFDSRKLSLASVDVGRNICDTVARLHRNMRCSGLAALIDDDSTRRR